MRIVIVAFDPSVDVADAKMPAVKFPPPMLIGPLR
jgi:hypothetical protein